MKALTKRELGSVALAIELLLAKEFEGQILLEYSTKAGKDWFIHFIVLDKFGKYRGQDFTFFGGAIAMHEEISIKQLIERAKEQLVSSCNRTIELATKDYPDYEKMQGKPDMMYSLAKILL